MGLTSYPIIFYPSGILWSGSRVKGSNITRYEMKSILILNRAGTDIVVFARLKKSGRRIKIVNK